VAGLGTDFGGDRLTGAINLNGYADAGPYRFTGFTGYAYSWDCTNKSVFSLIPPFFRQQSLRRVENSAARPVMWSTGWRPMSR
jgi:hypothetical protein